MQSRPISLHSSSTHAPRLRLLQRPEPSCEEVGAHIVGGQLDASSKTKIKVLNWIKYNPRPEAVNPSWFRVDKDLAFGQKLFGLNCEFKWLWICVLTTACEKNGDEFEWNYKYIEVMTGLNFKKQDQALDLFEEKFNLRVSRTDLRESRTDFPSTNETNERTNDLDQIAFDLESVYQRYPRKEGKTKGIQKLRKEIKTQEDFEKLIVAIENYSVSRRGEDPKFTKHFPTFVSEWRDWIEERRTAAPIKTGLDELNQTYAVLHGK